MEFLELVNAGLMLTVHCSSRSSDSVWIGMGRWRNLPAASPALAATFSCENLMRISQTDFFLLSRILPPANIFMVEVVGGRKILEQVPPPPFQSTLPLLVVLTLLTWCAAWWWYFFPSSSLSWPWGGMEMDRLQRYSFIQQLTHTICSALSETCHKQNKSVLEIVIEIQNSRRIYHKHQWYYHEVLLNLNPFHSNQT